MAPFGLLFLATADWTDPARTARRLALPAVFVVLAFAALFYLEHYFYPAHYPVNVIRVWPGDARDRRSR